MAIVAVAVALTAWLVPAATAGATPPSSLTGEFLSSGSTSQNGGTLVTSCTQTSPSTLSFAASGSVAAGPYPGTFTESGVVSLSTVPNGFYVFGEPLLQVATIDAFFTITSPNGDVTGTQHLVTGSNAAGLCAVYNNSPLGSSGSTVSGFLRELNPASDGYGSSYDAIITTPTGTYEDTGTAGLLAVDFNVTVISGPPVVNSNALNVGFSSAGLVPISAVGHATGGGQILRNGARVTFGFEARAGATTKGVCDLVDQAAAVKLHCTDVTALIKVSPTEVRITGHASLNGATTPYLIDAQDLASSGAGADTFSLVTGAGYTAKGAVERGNITVHA